jgi:CheY-like chemotaxis protein
LHCAAGEDNAVNQKVAVRLLEKAGATVITVSDGLQAVEAAQREAFDLVLMDVQMPEMDGMEACRRIRAFEAGTGRNTCIVAMTANAMPSDREQCLAAGMDGFLPKPVRAEALLHVLADRSRKELVGV